MFCLNASIRIVPIGLVKDFRPLGHSGQERLHAVVGSIETEIGRPQIMGLDNKLLSK